MGLRWVRRNERVIDLDDPGSWHLSTVQRIFRGLGMQLDLEVVHAHDGEDAGCECNIVQGES